MKRSWTGYFINLDRSTDRRAAFEEQLRLCGLSHRYSRFRAVEGIARPARSPLTAGAMGCFESHAAVVAEPNPGGGFVHVLEDDTLIPASFAGHMEHLIASGMLDEFDVVHTDISIMPRGFDYRNLRKLKAGFDVAMAAQPNIAFNLIDLRDFPYGGTASYVVTPAGGGKVRTLVRNELETGPSLEIDLLFQREVKAGRLRAACIFPFLTTMNYVYSSGSTITTRAPVSAEGLARRMARYSFFVDRDLSVVADALAPLSAQRAGDRHLSLLADIQRILISP